MHTQIQRFMIAGIVASFGASCNQDDALSIDDIHEEIIENLISAGYPQDDIQISDGQVYVGRDAHVTLEASREMVSDEAPQWSSSNLEQYRTNNLVSRSFDRICIDGRRISNGTLSAGLNDAINNYNQLNLSFTFVRTTGSSSGCDAVITAFQDSSSGGVAGFPSGGRPYGSATVGTGVASLGRNVAEHVWTHELGHCMGFRHSDYFNRSISCGGSAINEGRGSIGANHISGTPTGASVGGSVMNSCFRSTETGEFTSSDRTALRRLYPEPVSGCTAPSCSSVTGGSCPRFGASTPCSPPGGGDCITCYCGFSWVCPQ